MTKRPKPSTKKKTHSGKSKKPTCEWVGGRFKLPFWITEREPYRPDMALWLDVTNDLVLEHRLVHPDDPAEVVLDSFKRAMENSEVAPTIIRVEDPILAKRLRVELDVKARFQVGSVPEAEEFLDSMASGIEFGDGGGSYLGEGRVDPGTVGRFFSSAADLYRIVPWKTVTSEVEVMALDAPEFEVEGACINIIGQLGESTGFLVFESIEDYADFVAFAAVAFEEDSEVAAPPVSVFSVNFEGTSDLPESMRAEIKKYGWEVAGPKAFPQIVAFDEDGIPRPLFEKDVRFATACCQSLTRFLRKHSGAFKEDLLEPVTELMHLELPDRVSVRITLPHPALEDMTEISDLALDEDPEFALALGAAVEIVMEFVDAKRLEGEEEEWLEWNTLVIKTLYAFKSQEADRRVKPWSAKLVEEYLLDYVPQLSLGEEEYVMLLDVVGDFFDWMNKEKIISSRTVGAIGRLVGRQRSAVVKEKKGSVKSATRKASHRKK